MLFRLVRRFGIRGGRRGGPPGPLFQGDTPLLAVIDGLSSRHLVRLAWALGIVFAFEFVNGFYDTANAVATVNHTNSMKPWAAVAWRGSATFRGLFRGHRCRLGSAHQSPS